MKTFSQRIQDTKNHFSAIKNDSVGLQNVNSRFLTDSKFIFVNLTMSNRRGAIDARVNMKRILWFAPSLEHYCIWRKQSNRDENIEYNIISGNPCGLCSENESGLGNWSKPNWTFKQCRQQTYLNLGGQSIENVTAGSRLLQN